ncbi:DarT ssDNA thymidine ADP-ribosyltransferase family protein [Mucilaginibacter sp. UR6-1]|uniref:DarT ssDNA thymidine ADP-ribosyltransferase family protein n=1 Tax=Mucilaginibacter sp. UR6-1 TaxID=1435643 RepID=UPI0021077139|nr:DarT ssDNA thymidine ADP-ribosyltransferase family protein [Mucilaginibacter sp. UR6-1]
MLENIHNTIDHEAIGVTYWKDDNDLDLKRRKEAEFLLEDDLPVSALLGYAVFNDAAKQKLIAYGIQERVIAVRPQYYF